MKTNAIFINMPANKKLISLCNCGEPFQGENGKKHRQSRPEHATESEVYFCSVHREWGKKGDDFPHTGCLNVQLQKAQMKEVLRRVLPCNLERQIAKAEARCRNLRKINEKKGVEFKEEVKMVPELDPAEEIKQAVAAITPKRPVLLSDLSSSDSEGEKIEEVRPEQLSDISSDFERELNQDKVDKKRAHNVDLDKTESESEPPAQRVKMSSPKSVKSPSPKKLKISPIRRKPAFFPRRSALPVNQTLARNNLVDSNKKLEAQVKALQEEAALLRQKDADRRKWEADTKNRLNEMKAVEEERQEIERMKKEVQREKDWVSARRIELDEKQEKWEEEKNSLVAQKNEMLERMRAERDGLLTRLDEKEKEARLAVESATTHINRVGGLSHCVLHLEVVNNKVCRRSLESADGDNSICCFSDPSRQARCIHVDVTGHNLTIGAKNVRWPNERE